MPNNYAEIGYQGENIWRPVTISIADLVARHPGGYAVLMITRPGEREAYIAENMEQTADSVIWTPTDYDTARPGVISAQAIYSVNGEQVGKTAVHKYTVNTSLSAGDGTPYSWEDWVNELVEAAAGVDESISEAEETLDTAVQNAQDAQTAAETAQEKAEEAQGKAEDAQEAAETAEQNVNQTKAAIDQTKILIDQAKNAVDEAKEAVDDTADEVEQNAGKAEDNALKAEGYAVGTQEGTPATSGQPYFHDNAKYYKEQSEAAKDDAVAAKNRAEQVVDGIEAAGTAQVQRVTQEGGTQVTAVQNKGQEVLQSIPEDYTALTEEVSQLSNAIQAYEGGTTGQIPRKKSNANHDIEWASVGQPTDEQVADAVDNYLDAHPEQTTTVVDFSLTANKLVKGTLGYVIPQQFGAKGDGVTEDTQALKDCINYAIANNYAVHLPMGTYITRHGLSFTVADGQSLVIIGDGQNSTIKRMDDSLPAYSGSTVWARLFQITVSPVSAHANDVIFANFCIDSNRRNQSNATDGYEHESSADISIGGSESGTLENGLYVDRFIVDNMRFYDPVADCVNVSGSYQVGIRDVFIHNMVATDRHAKRNDIGITGNSLHSVNITGCDCGSIHFEYNHDPADENIIPYIITDCRFGSCTLGGRIDLEMANCIVKNEFLLNSMRFANIYDSKLSLGGSYTLHSDSNYGEYYFYNCTFTSDLVEGSNQLFYNRSVKRCELKNCKFIYIGDELTVDLDNDSVNDHVGSAIQSEQSNQNEFIIDGCFFDPVFTAIIYKPSSNKITLRNMNVDTGRILTGMQTLSSRTPSNITMENIKAGTGCPICLYTSNIGTNGFIINGTIITSAENFRITFDSVTNARSLSRITGTFNRHTPITEPLTLALLKTLFRSASVRMLFKGDTFEYTGTNPNAYPQKWVAIDSGVTEYNAREEVTSGTPLEERFICIGSGYGSTTDRPTCILSPGFEYFDTDLGKKIVWNGSTWVNCDGTALAS